MITKDEHTGPRPVDRLLQGAVPPGRPPCNDRVMSEEMQRLDQAFTVQWPGAGAVVIQTANQFLAQIDVAGEHPDQLILAIGQVTPPVVLGTPEQKRAQLEEIDEINVNTLARYSITLARLRELIGLLQQVERVLEGGKIPKDEGMSA